MSKLSHLEPKIVWAEFEKITTIPRPSKREGKIVEYLVNFAKEHNLKYKKDTMGNVVIMRPASEGMESHPTVILQSHVDMVCEKNSDTIFDFDTDPINVRIEPQGWVSADGTTLGADCGIGMAAALAILKEQGIKHPPIEALFTVDEETGLTGAFNLGADMLTGKYLINLDSEDEGELFVGCAGGIGTYATFTYKSEAAPKGDVFYRIDVNGLTGGHSGDDINKGRANSNRVLARMLLTAANELEMRLSYFEGGNLHNAIPREAYAIVAVPKKNVTEFFDLYERYFADIKQEFLTTEPNIDIIISEMPVVDQVVERETTMNLLRALVGVPNGVLSMSGVMEGLVETSSNLASVKFKDKNTILVTTSQRSSLESGKQFAADAVESVFSLASAKVTHNEGYPGWNPNMESDLLEVTTRSYKNLFGVEPKIKAIHAGLECGLFLERYPHLDMISFGPTLRGVHSPDERLEIVSVDRFWNLLLEVLRNL